MSLTDLSGTVARLSGGTTLTVTRRAAPTTDGRGRVVAGAASTFAIAASVQPVSGRDLLRLPEGLRTRELVAVFTSGALRTNDDATRAPPDTFAWQGATYQVEKLEDWGPVGGYVKAIAAKVES